MRRRVALLLVLLVSCSPIPLGDGEKKTVVKQITTGVILPTFDDLVARTGELKTAAQTLAAAPSEANLEAAREAWRAARRPWKSSEAWGFGPAFDLRLSAAIDQSPVDPSAIEAAIAGTAAIDDAAIEATGANKKGFHALEHMLFGPTPLAGERRLAMTVALAVNLEKKSIELRTAWAGDYSARFMSPGADDSVFPTIKQAVDALVNQDVFLAESIANERIGKPLGNATGGTPQPDLQESAPSDNSIADMGASLRGIRDVYLGARDGMEGSGIGALVAAQSAATDRLVRASLIEAIAAVDAIPRPYQTALLENRPAVERAYDASRSLKHVLATDVVGVLGSVLKFNDNDGD